ncbi:sulfurtransferase [Pseudogracilibacillus auburnensis]|uniref:sulfurtransferase n=1 Tax=Pseudogracilibacillus auburnensis TaxID=1494959 RepID=UPI001A95C30D|nr:sulfurtransferase [Pseudogracilibacillus auburnensis]MBO1002291.1 sulfurtransferase [Pseudogracilibacillus auburnensis]
MSIILNVEELKKMLDRDGIELVIIDVRTKDKQFNTGEEAYKHSHITGALFLDFKADLTGRDSFLPEPEKLAKKLGDVGINNETPILFYDQGNHRSASKAWVVMKYLGHERMYILEGGFSAWVDAGNEVTATMPKLEEAAKYRVNLQKELVVDVKGVKDSLGNETSVLIDSRAHERYTGEVEPTYKKAGHIPGALNYHSKQVFEDHGIWKDKLDLETHFASLKNKEELIVSCGSGNSACMNIVALKEAGFKNVKLYPGGFSEWIEDDNNEVATGDQSLF